jgi:nucleoside recognition membrane protein YjiH
MSWQEVVAVAVVLLGLGAGAFLVAQRPSFWIEFGSRLAKTLLPLAWRYVSKRMPPEE